jgi:hypothetical protein
MDKTCLISSLICHRSTVVQTMFKKHIVQKGGLLKMTNYWDKGTNIQVKQKVCIISEIEIRSNVTLREAWMSKKGLFRTLNGSLVLSICPFFIFSIRGDIISFSMHSSLMLKSQSPTGCP